VNMYRIYSDNTGSPMSKYSPLELIKLTSVNATANLACYFLGTGKTSNSRRIEYDTS